MNYVLLISRDGLFRFKKLDEKQRPSEVITIPSVRLNLTPFPEKPEKSTLERKAYRISDSIHTSRGIQYIHKMLGEMGLCESWALATAIEATETSPGYIHIYQEHL